MRVIVKFVECSYIPTETIADASLDIPVPVRSLKSSIMGLWRTSGERLGVVGASPPCSFGGHMLAMCIWLRSPSGSLATSVSPATGQKAV